LSRGIRRSRQRLNLFIEKLLNLVSKIKEIFTISAINTIGLKVLIFAILKKLEEMKNEEKNKVVEKVQPQVPVLRPHLDEAQFTIQNVNLNIY